MRQIIPLITFVLCVVLGGQLLAGEPPEQDVLQSLRKEHPRLLWLKEDEPRLRSLIATDPLARQWFEFLKAHGEKSLSQPPVEHVLIGPRLLDKSRKALERITLWGALYRLEGDKRFAERARQEMLAVSAFADWNPSHFLDVAEMTNAVATGYDWLYDTLSPEDRATIRHAIVELGLKQGLKVYERNKGWAVGNYNWTQVCNGGMLAGALAIADEEPELSRQIVNFARKSIPHAMASFAPDGGWAEGPGYWSYATQYNVYFLADAQTALGTDFGLNQTPGFSDAGLFRAEFIGPTGKAFNYADADEKFGEAPQMFWFARTFKRPLYAAIERAAAKKYPQTLDLLWYEPATGASTSEQPPLDAFFHGVNVVFLRSAWNDPEAFFIGFKGGDNRAGHAHLDLGTFVFDALGQRWASDLGADEYNLPGYFGKQRFTYYRLRTEGHNTLTIGNANQVQSAKAPIIAYQSTPGRKFAVADLSAAYGAPVTSARRGIEMLDGRRVVVADEVQADEPVALVWNFHTRAKTSIDPTGTGAILSIGKAKMSARILSPAGARFEIVSANPPPPQRQQPDVVNLTVQLPEKARQASIVVLFQSADDASPPPAVEPLAKWTPEN